MVLFAASDSLDDWEHKAPTPMLIRVQRLPQKMGDTLVDNNHGELAAVVLAECVLPTDAVALGIIDSTVARSKIQNLCNRVYVSGRQKTRSVISGVSKALTCQLEREQLKARLLPIHDPRLNAPETDDEVAGARATLLLMSLQLEAHVSRCKEKPWRKEYLDKHPIRPWCKVDSHQLKKEDGSKGTRYEHITPNECLVQANHVADQACDYAMGMMKDCERNAIFEQPVNIIIPLGLRYEVFLGERACDRNTSKSVNAAVSAEFLRRAQSADKQGAALRAMEFCRESCKYIPNHGTVTRLFQGLGNCHTRSIYKDAWYRMRCYDATKANQAIDSEAAEVDSGDDGSSSSVEAKADSKETPVFPSEEAKELCFKDAEQRCLMVCPFCNYEVFDGDDDFDPRNLGDEQALEVPGPHGNVEHHHLYCREESITAMRHVLNSRLDIACEEYCGLLMKFRFREFLTARLEALVDTLSELERVSSKTMYTWVVQKKLPARTRNLMYPWQT
jgi:hypothetical protein